MDPPPTAPPPSEPPVTSTREATPTITGVSITASGTATAGETFRLMCTVTVTGSNDQLMITWLMGPMINTNADGVTVVTSGGMSTLTFNPLAASHAGTYTRIATLGSAMEASMTYQWLKNGAVVSGQKMATLSFSPLTFSDAGNYTCQATVTSSLLSDPITTASSSSESVQLTCRSNTCSSLKL